MWASPPTVGQKAAPEGLEPVIRSMVEAIPALTTDKAVKLFEEFLSLIHI